MIKKIIFEILRLSKIHKVIFDIKELETIRSCTNAVTNYGGSFYSSANVVNMGGNKMDIKIGENTHIRGELLTFKYGGRIFLGENCFLGENSKIWSGESILIGNDVLISHNVNIMDSSAHEIDFLERSDSFKSLLINGFPSEKGSILTSPIVIENNVWINFNTIILRGVTIGKGSIIAAGSVVTKDIPPFVLAGGNPCKVLKYLVQ